MKKIKNIPWNEKIKSEKGFVKTKVYQELLPDLFETIGENMPEELLKYISENPKARDGYETEVQVTNKHLSARATNSGRADLCIPFKTKNDEDHVLWVEVMDKSGKWDWNHHDQWKKKITSFMERYDKVIPIMIADQFNDNFIKNFDDWSSRGYEKTHAIELNFLEIEKEWGFNIKLKTDSYLDNQSYHGGETPLEIENRDYYQKLLSSFENTNIEICSNNSEQKSGYFHIKYNGQWAGFYLRKYANNTVALAGQNKDYASRHKSEVYDMMKHSSDDVKKMIKDCANISLTFKDAKDPVFTSDKHSSVENSKELIESFINCIIDAK